MISKESDTKQKTDSYREDTYLDEEEGTYLEESDLDEGISNKEQGKASICVFE